MLNLGFTPSQIIQKGIWSGLLATLIGSLTFTMMETFFMLTLSISGLNRFPILKLLDVFGVFVVFVPFVFCFVALLTFLPNLVGGVLMVWGINQYSQYKPVFKNQAISIGSGIGSVIASTYAFFTTLVIYYSFP